MNSKKFEAHKCVGGQFSPEMELPKLRWIKKNLPHRWSKVAYAFDLVDFLTFKCTGETTRSSCTLVCKWGWIPSGNGSEGDWEEALIEWSDLTELRDIARGTVLFPGTAAGAGLNKSAAHALSLPLATPVAIGLIDAHAGALGILKTKSGSEAGNRMAIIAGTSCCHMLMLRKSAEVVGVWGPYLHGLLPNRYLMEGGQSSAGSTLQWLTDFANTTPEALESEIGELSPAYEKSSLVIITDFHGNRSPLANPKIKGSIHGLGLATRPKDVFVGILQGLAIGTRHISERIQNFSGETIEQLVITGGLSKSGLYNQINANANQIPVIIPDTENTGSKIRHFYN